MRALAIIALLYGGGHNGPGRVVALLYRTARRALAVVALLYGAAIRPLTVVALLYGAAIQGPVTVIALLYGDGQYGPCGRAPG